jgi:hypothetical protein
MPNPQTGIWSFDFWMCYIGQFGKHVRSSYFPFAVGQLSDFSADTCLSWVALSVAKFLLA